MRNYKKYIVFGFVSALVIYAVFSFVKAEMNPILWDLEDLACVAVTWTVVMVVFFFGQLEGL